MNFNGSEKVVGTFSGIPICIVPKTIRSKRSWWQRIKARFWYPFGTVKWEWSEVIKNNEIIVAFGRFYMTETMFKDIDREAKSNGR